MKIPTILFRIVLILVFSACATQKGAPPRKISAEDYNFYLMHGSNLLKQKDYESAIVHLKKAISINPNVAKAYNLLGIAYFQGKDYRLAKVQIKKAIDIDPSYAQAYSNLGSVCFMLREFEEAEKMFKKALALSPDLVSAHYSLGTLLIVQGKIQESTLYLSKGIELDPDFFEKHKAFVSNFSSLAFGSAEIYFTYAKIYASLGKIEETLEYLKKAKRVGFRDWYRIDSEKEFENVRDDQRIREFIR